MLDVTATNRGLLVPRMTTTQRNAIASPANGLMVFDTNTRSYWFYDVSAWKEVRSSTYLTDADNDTKIQVEESADEDRIRFDLGGSERLVLRRNAGGGTMLELGNNGSNTFFGSYAGQSNSSGTDNTFSGYYSGYMNSSGYNNTFLGSQAGTNNSTGVSNTFIGKNAGNQNTTASWNTFLGEQSGYQTTIGISNTFIGNNSGSHNTYGGGNTAVGHSSNWTNPDLFNCSFLGSSADASVAGLVNATALGQLATVSASDQVRIGNTAVTSIGGFAGWTNLSDGRFKRNLQESVPGLAFITRLRPVTYNLDIQGVNTFLGRDEAARDFSEKEKIAYSGFIAQEVEQAAIEKLLAAQNAQTSTSQR